MAFAFGEVADAIDEGEGVEEILEAIGFREVVRAHGLPVAAEFLEERHDFAPG
ncbi:MAG TPA: hypothetical protein VIG32_09380 [Candidatus Baltobacteraceae bacterium]